MTRRQELRLRLRTHQPRYWTADMNHCVTFSINTSTAAAATVLALIILVFSFKPSDFCLAFEKCALAAWLALARSHSCLVFSWQTDGAKFNSSYLLEGKTLHAKQSLESWIYEPMHICDVRSGVRWPLTRSSIAPQTYFIISFPRKRRVLFGSQNVPGRQELWHGWKWIPAALNYSTYWWESAWPFCQGWRLRGTKIK